MRDNDLELAKQLLRMGKNIKARQIVESFLKENRSDIQAWWLYAETWPIAEDRIRIWGYCLRFNPNSEEAKRALATLQKEQATGKPLQVVRRKRKTSLFFKIFSGCSFIFIILMLGVVFKFLMSRPIDPTPYLHKSPVTHYLYVPENYTDDRVWPLFVGVHSGGGSGVDCWNLWQEYADEEGFILACPSIPGDGGGFYQDVGEVMVNSSIENARNNYRVKDKVFLAGYSAGAYFIQGYAYHYPESVSGLAILSTGYTIIGLEAKVPMLLVNDRVEYPESAKANDDFYKYMIGKGYDIEYHISPGINYWVTDEAKQLTIELFRKTIGK